MDTTLRVRRPAQRLEPAAHRFLRGFAMPTRVGDRVNFVNTRGFAAQALSVLQRNLTCPHSEQCSQPFPATHAMFLMGTQRRSPSLRPGTGTCAPGAWARDNRPRFTNFLPVLTYGRMMRTDTQVDRRRNPDVPRQNGERWTDTRLANRYAERTAEERLWLWGSMLWGAAAMVGAVYGIGWLRGLI